MSSMLDNTTRELFIEILETPCVITEELERTIMLAMLNIVDEDDIKLLEKVIDKYAKDILTNDRYIGCINYDDNNNLFMDLFRVKVQNGYYITKGFVVYLHRDELKNLLQMSDIVKNTNYDNIKHLYNYMIYVFCQNLYFDDDLVNIIEKHVDNDFKGEEYDTLKDALKKYYFCNRMFSDIIKCINQKMMITHNDISIMVSKEPKTGIDNINTKEFIERLMEEGQYKLDYETYLIICRDMYNYGKHLTSRFRYRYLEHLKDNIDDRYYDQCVEKKYIFNMEFFQNPKLKHLEDACENNAIIVIQKCLEMGLIPNMKCIIHMYRHRDIDMVTMLEEEYIKAGNIITNEDKFECIFTLKKTKMQQIAFLE